MQWVRFFCYQGGPSYLNLVQYEHSQVTFTVLSMRNIGKIDAITTSNATTIIIIIIATLLLLLVISNRFIILGILVLSIIILVIINGKSSNSVFVFYARCFRLPIETSFYSYLC